MSKKQYLDENGAGIIVKELVKKDDELRNGIKLASGTENGTLKLTVLNDSVDNIPVTGLQDTAYLPSSNFSPIGGSTSLSQLASIIRLGTGGSGTGGIYQDSDTYHQKFEILDNGTAGDAVFRFSQSSDAGKTFVNLAEIRDDGNVVAKTFTGTLIGNASTATRATSSDKLTNSRTLTIGGVSKSDNGTGNLTWSLSDLGVSPNNHTHNSLDAIDISNKTVDVNSYTLSTGSPKLVRYIEKTNAGAANITNIPIADLPFVLIAELIRYNNSSDYITKQTFIAANHHSTYERWCMGGSWTNWLPISRFSLPPVSGQVLVADGATGAIKSSGFTIAKSVPSNAIFTDTNDKVTNTLATTSKAYVTGTTSTTTNTGTQVFDTGVYLGTEVGQIVATKFTGILDGNAKTATRATTADKFTTSRSLKIGNTSKTDSGNNALTWTLGELGAVSKSGDSMTGLLTLSEDPSSALHAATKQYVDTKINTSLSAVDYMHLKGTVGTNGTVTTLPTSNVKVGDSYKVITSFTLAADKSHSDASINVKIGDILIAMTTAPKWLHIPSGDEPTTTIRYSTTTTNLTASAKTGDVILGFAASKQIDTTIAAGSTSGNLPTSSAVANYAVKKTGDSMSGDLTLTSGNIYLTKGIAANNSQEIRFTCGVNDFARIMAGGESDLGYLEIATSDNGNEPIYIRQYKGFSTDPVRTLTLLDGAGNSQFPGTISATGGFTGSLITSTAISSSLSTDTYLAGNQGKAIINSTSGAGKYVMLAKLSSTNGYFTHGAYQNKYLLQYTAKSVVDAGNNTTSKSITLLDESGNSYFPGTVTAPKFSGALSGNASTATKSTQDSAGQQINTTYIKNITGSGTTITFTKGDGTTGTTSIRDTTYPISERRINADFATKYRTQTKGNTTSGYYITAIRNDTKDVANSPQYGSGVAVGIGDTHSYFYTNYNSPLAYIGGGNGDVLNWVKQVAFTDSSISGNAASSSRLKNYYSSRPTSANIPVVGDGSLIVLKATTSMTTGKPPSDSHILHFEWDNSGGYNAQLAVSTTFGNIYTRGMDAGTWQSWKTFLHSGNYSSYAAPKSHASTATTYGIGTASNYGHVKLSDTYASNVGAASTGIVPSQSALYNAYVALNGKFGSYLPLAGGTVTGTLTLSKSMDAAGATDNKPALIVGGTSTNPHLELDPNEIQAKNSGTTTGPLYLNNDGGLVSVGGGGLKVNGLITGTNNIALSGTITSPKTTGTHLAGNQGSALINSTAGAGQYTMLCKLNSKNGYFTDGVWESRRMFFYTAKSTVDAGTNTVTKQVTILDESGNSQFPGTITAPTFKGSLSGNATSATKATQDGSGNVITSKYVTMDTAQNITGKKTFTSEVVSTSANGFRIAYGNYGLFLRNDGSDTWFLLTNSGDQLGGYNSLRPFRINNASGTVYVGNGLSSSGTTTLSGPTTVSGVATFTNTLNASGITKFTNATESSSGTTGAVIVSGGLGVSKRIVTNSSLFVGDSDASKAIVYLNNKKAVAGTDAWLRINDTKAFTSGIYCGAGLLRTDGTFQVGNNGSGASLSPSAIQLKQPTTISNTTSITNATDSTSTTTGALKVSGGVGVAKKMSAASIGIANTWTLSVDSATGALNFIYK